MTTRISRTPAVLLALGATAALVGVAVVSAAPGAASESSTQQQAQARLGQANASDAAYAIGYFLGDEVRFGLDSDEVTLDNARIVEGFTAAIMGREPAVDARAMDDALAAAHNAVQERIVQRRLDSDAQFKELHDRNLERSRAFHASFTDQPGAQTLPSGAQYRVIESGQGEPVGADATVVVTFRGALLDGRVFTEGEGVEISLADLTPGVRELMARMTPGDWWQLAVPPGLAYGGFGKPEMGVGPNETLIGDVKMLEVR
ncbi:MAG: FKBP-type peptidyl-prolyl cis-trans isomerase N-terminal domain-containing protein [Phycisphaerales bacterium JB064]